MDALEICNKLRSEASGVATSGIPLDVFPQKMQQMILDLARTENYSIEFTATSLISAMAAAVGNSCYIRIKGNWITSPILYVILVGRPGVGKTPPLNFAYKPLHDIDTEEHHKFKALKNEYAAIAERNKGKKRTEWESLPPVPVLHKNIMNDLVSTEATDPVKKQVLDSLGNKFLTAEAVKAGADFGFARRTVMYMLKDFCQRNFIIKDKQGNYEKVQK